MKLIFIILITIWISWPVPIIAGECRSKGEIIITAPQPGMVTYAHRIAVRGFLCEDTPMVMVMNRTTDQSHMAETDRICSPSGCISQFAVLIDDLIPGANELSAKSLNGFEITVKVIRSALASSH